MPATDPAPAFHPDLVADGRDEAGRAADFLHRLAGRGVQIPPLTRTTLLELAAGIAIVLGVDRFLDMCRTTVNVTADMTTAVFVARTERGQVLTPP